MDCELSCFLHADCILCSDFKPVMEISKLFVLTVCITEVGGSRHLLTCDS